MSDFSLVSLRVIAEVDRLGSFSAAASVLGYTQSAVSRQVALAERAAGCRLFDRLPRGVETTAAGEIVIRRAGAALAELTAARGEIDRLEQRRLRRLRLGAFSTAMASLVPGALVALAARDPSLAVTLREGTSDRLVTAVASARLEAAVVSSTVTVSESVALEELLEDPLLVALPRAHPLAGRTRLAPHELADESWIVGSTDPATTLLGAWSAPGSKPRIAYEVRDWTAKIGLVAAGLGVTVVPALSARTLPRTIAVAGIDDPAAVRSVAAARRRDADATVTGPLVEALRASASVTIGAFGLRAPVPAG